MTVYFEDIEVGYEIPRLVKQPTTLQLFRYSAATWNAHRIHFDHNYALSEGHPAVLVQAHLHGAYLAQVVMDWIGTKGKLIAYGWKNRARSIPGDTLTCIGKVTGKRWEGNLHLVDLDITETNQDNVICATGTATVELPSRKRN